MLVVTREAEGSLDWQINYIEYAHNVLDTNNNHKNASVIIHDLTIFLL